MENILLMNFLLIIKNMVLCVKNEHHIHLNKIEWLKEKIGHGLIMVNAMVLNAKLFLNLYSIALLATCHIHNRIQ